MSTYITLKRVAVKIGLLLLFLSSTTWFNVNNNLLRLVTLKERDSLMDDKIRKTIEENKEKGFVQRILRPEQYPKLQNKDGSFSTHSMSWGNIDGKNIVFPTVLYDKDNNVLRRYTPREAIDHSLKTGNFIEFKTPEEADYFSKEYKQAWKK